MNQKTRLKIISLIISLLLSISSLVIADYFGLRQNLTFVYFFSWICLAVFYWKNIDSSNFFLRPTFLLISYILLTFGFGAALFSAGAVIDQRSLQFYGNWSHLFEASMFFIFATHATAFGATFCNESCEFPEIDFNSKKESRIIWILMLIGITTLSLLCLSTFFWNHELLFIPRTISSLAIIVAVWRYRIKSRWIIYASILSLLAVISVENKREAIFVLLPILLFEFGLVKNRATKVSILRLIKLSISGFLLGGFLLVLITSMSIIRGYGNYEVDSFVDSFQFVGDYLLRKESIAYLGNNFELSYVFFHSHNAVDSIISRSTDPTYGTTLFKTFFIGIPSTIFTEKPDSILESYTRHYDPDFRSIGGSYPINLYSELFWNFSIFSLGIIPIIAFLIEKFFSFKPWNKIVFCKNIIPKLVLWGFAYEMTLVWFRGSGLDILVVYLIFGIISFTCLIYLPYICFLKITSFNVSPS